MTPEEPLDIAVDQQRLARVCARYGVIELSLFGSVARGDAGDESDDDLLYVLDQDRHLGFSINDLAETLTHYLA